MLDLDGLLTPAAELHRWLVQKTQDQLREALTSNPGYTLKIIGHSLGGGTAAIATMMYALFCSWHVTQLLGSWLAAPMCWCLPS